MTLSSAGSGCNVLRALYLAEHEEGEDVQRLLGELSGGTNHLQQLLGEVEGVSCFRHVSLMHISSAKLTNTPMHVFKNKILKDLDGELQWMIKDYCGYHAKSPQTNDDERKE